MSDLNTGALLRCRLYKPGHAVFPLTALAVSRAQRFACELEIQSPNQLEIRYERLVIVGFNHAVHEINHAVQQNGKDSLRYAPQVQMLIVFNEFARKSLVFSIALDPIGSCRP